MPKSPKAHALEINTMHGNEWLKRPTKAPERWRKLLGRIKDGRLRYHESAGWRKSHVLLERRGILGADGKLRRIVVVDHTVAFVSHHSGLGGRLGWGWRLGSRHDEGVWLSRHKVRCCNGLWIHGRGWRRIVVDWRRILLWVESRSWLILVGIERLGVYGTFGNL